MFAYQCLLFTSLNSFTSRQTLRIIVVFTDQTTSTETFTYQSGRLLVHRDRLHFTLLFYSELQIPRSYLPIKKPRIKQYILPKKGIFEPTTTSGRLSQVAPLYPTPTILQRTSNPETNNPFTSPQKCPTSNNTFTKKGNLRMK